MSASREQWGEGTVSATLLHTESTTDLLDAIPVFSSTVNQASEQAIVLGQQADQLLLLSFLRVEADQALSRTEYVSIDGLGGFLGAAANQELPRTQYVSIDGLGGFLGAAANQELPRTEYVSIDDLGEAGYRVLQAIPVEIRRVGIGDFEASFREANIAISGRDQADAYQALVAEILETFDVLLTEQNLGPDATEQRQILRTYIVRA